MWKSSSLALDSVKFKILMTHNLWVGWIAGFIFMTLNPANETWSLNDSDYRASKIIPNDTKLEPISWELISEIQFSIFAWTWWDFNQLLEYLTRALVTGNSASNGIPKRGWTGRLIGEFIFNALSRHVIRSWFSKFQKIARSYWFMKSIYETC